MKTDLFKLELFIAHILRKGVIIAGIFISLGWLLQLNFIENVFVHFQHYQPTPLLETLAQLRLQNNWPAFLSYIGLFILISLPIIRVLATGFIFAWQRNFKMLSLVVTVFAGLCLGIALGFTH